VTEQSRATDCAVPAAGEVVLAADDVHVRYRVYDQRSRSLRRLVANGFRGGRYREVHAVRGVDLTVRRGEALGVIGRNGSGKSTLLRALAGLVPPSSGMVRARSMPVLLGVGSVLQGELSCRRNVHLGATALGISRSEAKERTQEVLRFAGVEDFADLPFRTLSSGMRARLQFSIATAVQPDILMIDETLGVGDAEFRAKSEGRMAEMIGGAGTVVFVSHSMAQMKRVCTRLVWLNKGVVLADGDPAEVVESYESDVRAMKAAAGS
jgi:teichoic acid transport system ATP-binding protein